MTPNFYSRSISFSVVDIMKLSASVNLSEYYLPQSGIPPGALSRVTNTLKRESSS